MTSQTTNKRNIKSDVVDISSNNVSNGASLINIILERGNEDSEAKLKQLLELLEKMPRPRLMREGSDEQEAADEELKGEHYSKSILSSPEAKLMY